MPVRPGGNRGASVPSVPVRGSPWVQSPERPHGYLGVRRFISAFQSHVSFILGFALQQEPARCPEGSEHRTSGLRMAPGDAAHVPRPPSPVAEAGPVARHFRSRARLRRLLAGLRPSPPSPPALRATPGGASLTTFGFVTIVPRYLPKASNSLTFVRGADRACCAPRKWLYSLICAPRKWLCWPPAPLTCRSPPAQAVIQAGKIYGEAENSGKRLLIFRENRLYWLD